MTKKLTIICITYNQINFIQQTIESFLIQKTNFDFDIIIHDDCSNDGTTDIVKKYEEKYPNKIKAIYQQENQWSQGNPSIIFKKYIFPLVDTEYVIFCEGDDYFIDENKLQKQVDFLDKNKEYSICFHPVKIIYEDKSQTDAIFPTNKFINNKTTLNINDLFVKNFIQTNSAMYRWRQGDKGNMSELLPNKIMPIDYFIHLLHAEIGKIYFMQNEIMAVYRKWHGGVWIDSGKNLIKFYTTHGSGILNFNIEKDKHFKTNSTSNIKSIFKKVIESCLISREFIKLEKYSQDYKDLYDEYLKSINLNKHNKFQLYKSWLFSHIFFGEKRIKYKNKYNSLKSIQK